MIRRVGCFRAAATLYVVGIRIASPRLEPLLNARHHEQLQQATADNAQRTPSMGSDPVGVPSPPRPSWITLALATPAVTTTSTPRA